mgnify:CR=1 FL=1
MAPPYDQEATWAATTEMKREMLGPENRVRSGDKPNEDISACMQKTVTRGEVEDLEIVCYRTYPVEFCKDIIETTADDSVGELADMAMVSLLMLACLFE